MEKEQIFQRYEKKYLLNSELEKKIKSVLREKMREDQYASYTISNIYLDSDESILIERSIEHPVYKEKLRLRSYITPSPSDNVFFEIKKKFKGLGSKRRVVLTQEEISAYLLSGSIPSRFNNSQIFRELDYAVKLYDAKPKMFIAYDRSAYKNKDGADLRITFDKNIRYRTDNLDLSYGAEGKMLMGDMDFVLMEVKAENSIPLWLAELYEDYGIKRIQFSKYGNCYKQTLNKFGGF